MIIDGYTADEAEVAFRVEIDAKLSDIGSVRYVSAVAGNGFRYAVTISELPEAAAAREGGPVLVTVTSPWVDAWALQRTGYLHEGYVHEHFCGSRHASDSDVRALTMLLRYALDRESAHLEPN